ncbi:hypothetical protein DDE74_08710 [Streptomyces lydicus]|uniref:Uncharacterized protein n=1 Tax=Streptomyces lydicus TaxID=47763 RepID=A0A3S9Y7P8_9ACTN|nr:hypothetical protein DDE74_08710 [Streptomyces lydicus]
MSMARPAVSYRALALGDWGLPCSNVMESPGEYLGGPWRARGPGVRLRRREAGEQPGSDRVPLYRSTGLPVTSAVVGGAAAVLQSRAEAEGGDGRDKSTHGRQQQVPGLLASGRGGTRRRTAGLGFRRSRPPRGGVRLRRGA